MLVLGIDPGTATTGYGLVRQARDGSLAAVAHGVITTPAKTPMPERLIQLYEELNEIIKLHRPESSAVEMLFFQTNVKTAISVGQARGVVLLALAQAGLPIGEYTPNAIKQAVTGYGSADKHQMQEMTKMLLGLKERPRPDDAADALAVAICHLHSSSLDALPRA
ncbi:MAG TPA: crossover junction endodeoxyribonuclease RuvC [Anaerolineales bacterium]|nr:crossover junction endodeoxyribonuclease RuvC [Anaerolineales bacterium]